MRILQFLPTLAFGDAVSNDAIAIHHAIEKMGYNTHIYCENLDKRIDKRIADDIVKGMPEINEDDVFIYHLSTGSKLSYELPEYKNRLMVIYHNITPAEFFKVYNYSALANVDYGIKGMKHLADKADYCMADSEFNKQDLINAGYKCRIDVRPILIPFEDYARQPDSRIIRKYKDGRTNIVFVGRIAPNKKQEDLISTFCYYKKNIDPEARLIIVGNPAGFDTYYERLKRYVAALELDDVIFTGHISFPEILGFYHAADVFLCMSEHEGFCVPLVEAMYFGVPVIAYKSCAVPDTMGGSGIVTDSKEPVEIALLIDRLMKDSRLRQAVIDSQKKRLEDFSYENVSALFERRLKAFLAGE